MKDYIDRKVTITLNLTDVAKNFKYILEVDSHCDVYHEGYSQKYIRNNDFILPEGMDNLNKFFPQVVAIALEDAERDAYAVAIRKAKILALEACLLKIDLMGGGAEYTDTEGNSVSAKAGIVEVSINEENDEIEVTILNPEHLINAIISGRGYFASDLSSTEPAENSELIQKFHLLNDFFEIYGESKPSGDLSSQYSPDINDEFFKEELNNRISELTLDEVGQAVLDYVEAFDVEANCEDFANFVNFSASDIKKIALELNNDKKNFVEGKIK